MKLVILDRDGVINIDSKNYIKNVSEWRPIPGSINAIARLKLKGFNVAVATNQSGISRNYFTLETLSQIHNQLNKKLIQIGVVLDGIHFCPHLPASQCSCRKPRPGLLENIQRSFQSSYTSVCYIGDSKKDIEAANNAGVLPILLRTGNGVETEKKLKDKGKIKVYDDLSQAVDALIHQDV